MDATSQYEALVLQLEQVEGTEQTILALRAAGEDAKPALLEGMRHPSYRVRRGCLLVLDHSIIDDATRLVVLQAADGYDATIKRGSVIAEGGALTGERPGRLLRGAQSTTG